VLFIGLVLVSDRRLFGVTNHSTSSIILDS
jgi:hypothetical protein